MKDAIKKDRLVAHISGIGISIPDKIITNYDLEKMVDTSDEWIKTRTGISERRVVEPGVATSDLATEAAQKAILDAGLEIADIGMILVATMTPDMAIPATACIVQKKLGTTLGVAFDINAACSGFIYALAVADKFIASGAFKHILVIGADVMSHLVDWEDRTTCVLFGDGAGAVILSCSTESGGILSTHLYSDGRYSELLMVPAGGSLKPTTQETVTDRLHYISMKGNELFRVAVKNMVIASQNALIYNNCSINDVDLFVAHQANKRIIDAVAERVGIDPEKVVISLHKYGNTSAASIPMALFEAIEQKKLKKGHLVLLTAFGGGLTWGSSLIRWSK